MNNETMPPKAFSYDDALQEIEATLERLETTRLPIDQVISESQKVAQLITKCRNKLSEVGEEVDKILLQLRQEQEN